MGAQCRSRARFGRCGLQRHEGALHAVYIGAPSVWFVYKTQGGHAKPIDEGYRRGLPETLSDCAPKESRP